MKKLVTIPFLLVYLVTVIIGQTKNSDKVKLVQLPLEFGTVTIIPQPDCPVKIEEAQLFVKPNGSNWDIKYIVRNKSSKGIRYLSYGFVQKSVIGQWNKFGDGFEENVGQNDGKGEIFLTSNDFIDKTQKDKFEIVPMTKEVRKLFTNEDGKTEMKSLWIGMVTKIAFEDGTTYDAKKQYNDLENLFHFDN